MNGLYRLRRAAELHSRRRDERQRAAYERFVNRVLGVPATPWQMLLMEQALSIGRRYNAVR